MLTLINYKIRGRIFDGKMDRALKMEKSCKKKLVNMFIFMWNSTITSKAKKSTFDLKITFGEHFGGCSVRKSIFLQNVLIFNFWSKLCYFKTWCTFFRIIALCKFLCLSGLLTTLYILGNNNFKFKNILFGKKLIISVFCVGILQWFFLRNSSLTDYSELGKVL